MRRPDNRANNDGWAAGDGAANVACRYPAGRAESTNLAPARYTAAQIDFETFWKRGDRLVTDTGAGSHVDVAGRNCRRGVCSHCYNGKRKCKENCLHCSPRSSLHKCSLVRNWRQHQYTFCGGIVFLLDGNDHEEDQEKTPYKRT